MNQSGFASHRGVSRKTVTGWKHRGLLVFSTDGSVDVAASDKALLGHGILLPSERQSVTSPNTLDAASLEGLLSKAQAETVKENYAALLRRLEYERESGRVVVIDDVAMHVRAEFAIVRQRLRAIAEDLAPRLAQLRSPEEIKAVVDAAVRHALEDLSAASVV